MWIDTQRGEHPVVLVGDRERRSAGIDAGADGDDPGHPCGKRPLDEGRGRLLARVEVRVRVGHEPAAASIRASSSATTRSASSFA